MDTWCTKQEKEYSANLDGIEAVVHNRDEEVSIHCLHFLDVGCDWLKCCQTHIEVNIIQVSLIKGIQLRQSNKWLMKNDRNVIVLGEKGSKETVHTLTTSVIYFNLLSKSDKV